MPTVEERLASLESNETHRDKRLDKLDKIEQDVAEIKLGLSKQKGFIAGIMFIVVPLWSALLMFMKSFWDRLSA